ncbi:DUF7310 family coiled-coil domain-containing protein [Haloarchaeobius sp. TZWSO28]|uniref:DUF7310 family coiled-coil domain-containing protein n=1 Tax=Haloarchaeobius sp. TZWSO28 TaxID=3446119 RepID=UPI003EB912A8
MSDQLNDRLRAVERAISDDDAVSGTMGVDSVGTTPEPGPTSETTPGERGAARLTDRLDELEATVAELDAAVQALRGYAGNVRSVNERVEKRADGALAAVESLEARVEELEASARKQTERTPDRADPPDSALAAEWATSTSRRGGGSARQYSEGPTDEPDPYTIPTPEEDSEQGGLLARVREVL